MLNSLIFWFYIQNLVYRKYVALQTYCIVCVRTEYSKKQ